MAVQTLKDTFMPYGRSREMNGSYDYLGVDYAERVKEKQAVPRAEQAKDEYISSEKSETKPVGLYRIGQDENGSRKIFFDAPKADHADGKDDRSGEGEDGKGPKVSGDNQGKPAEKCVTNTDKVDREIKKLKEKKQQLEQQIQSASGDEKKIRELEKKLAQVENELSQKDNDTYRRQNASVSEVSE